MLNKLQDLYPNSVLIDHMPNFLNNNNLFWFQEAGKWLGIPAKAITEEELTLLKVLLDYHEPDIQLLPAAKNWYDFLYNNGGLPQFIKNTPYRILYFKASDGDWDIEDIESAFKGFFMKENVILWRDRTKGIIIEEFDDNSPTEDEVYSISIALESDFFIKTYFYIGMPQNVTKAFAESFIEEQTFFTKGIQLIPARRVFTFEKVFPYLLISELQEELKDNLFSRLHVLKEDPELLTTVKVFLQNNSNTSQTAKKLYIHRNSLQYRLEKFSEKSGINLKDFDSAATVYLACLLYDQNRENT